MALLESIGSAPEYSCQALCQESGVSKGTVTATCPAGTSLLGGGGLTTPSSGFTSTWLAASYPSASDTWKVTGEKGNSAVATSLVVQAFAVCTS